ncbi:RWP-RK domain-containing protein [Artemisia annua]|uniref:RWP-RK domain-containing protein n=1 Tax=Artemisia annua TaxID=35608 RepID=A0A2U1LEG6_ARTAN|nr:RWP-RK domain-containing protein [Artemisia annua]
MVEQNPDSELAEKLQHSSHNNSSNGEDIEDGYAVKWSQNDHAQVPSLSDMLHKTLVIDSKTIFSQNGKIQSYCGLRLNEIVKSFTGQTSRSVGTLTDMTPNQMASTSKQPFMYKKRKSAGTLSQRATKKIPHGAAHASAAPCEAVWRLFSYDIHYSYPSVMKLNYHLPNQHAITLRDSESLPALIQREGIDMTMFTDCRPLKLWEENWKFLSEDILHKKRIIFDYPDLELTEEQLKNYCLIEIQELLNRNGRSLSDFQDLPVPDPRLITNMDNRLIREALNYDMKQTTIYLHSILMSLNRDIISHYYHMPLHKAAKYLDVSLSAFKIRCRLVGIKCWPYRKLLSLEKLINYFQRKIGGAQTNEKMREIITMLREEKRQIQENPELPISNNTKRLRQRFFKATHRKKNTINLELSLATPVLDVEPLQVIYPNNRSGNEEIEFAYGSDYEYQE